MPLDRDVLARFHRVLVEEIRRTSPDYLSGEFTVAEIYQKLVPYGAHRDRIGVEMNGDYEDALLRLLAGEEDRLRLQSEPARQRIRRELESSNPNTGIYREFAAVGVRLNPDRISPAPKEDENPPVGRGDSETRSGGDGARLLDAGAAGSGPRLFDLAAAEPPEAPGALSGKPGKPGASSAAGSAPESVRPPPEAPEREAPASQLLPPAECPACDGGLPRRAGLRFCPFCGVNVLERACRDCGEPLEWGWAYCVACGSGVEEA